MNTAKEIYAVLFGHSPDQLADVLKTRARIPDGVGFRAQLLDHGTASAATSATVLFSLLRAGQLTTEEYSSWLDEISPPHPITGASVPVPYATSAWAQGLVLYCEALLAPIESREALVYRIEETIALQNGDGGWPFSRPSRPSKVLYTFYPTLALIRLWKHGALPKKGRAILDSLNAVAQFVETFRADDLVDELMIQHLSSLLTSAGIKCNPRLARQSFLQQLAQPVRRTTLLRTVTEPTVPLFYIQVFEPALYLCARSLLPCDAPFQYRLIHNLRNLRTQAPVGFTTQELEPEFCVWASALGLLTGLQVAEDYLKADLHQPLDHVNRAISYRDHLASFQYHVAISFSGPQRSLAARLHKLLTRRGLRVFYDDAEAHRLAGRELTEVLTDIYMNRAKLVVVMISEDYAKSAWAYNIEWRAILARMIERRDAQLIPYRLDDAVLEGLRPSIGYLDAARYSLPRLCDIVAAQLEGVPE